MKDVRMFHAFDLKSLVVMSPYVVRDRGFLIRVKTSGFKWYVKSKSLDNNETWCVNFAKISSIAKWLCLGHHSFVIS